MASSQVGPQLVEKIHSLDFFFFTLSSMESLSPFYGCVQFATIDLRLSLERNLFLSMGLSLPEDNIFTNGHLLIPYQKLVLQAKMCSSHPQGQRHWTNIACLFQRTGSSCILLVKSGGDSYYFSSYLRWWMNKLSPIWKKKKSYFPFINQVQTLFFFMAAYSSIVYVYHNFFIHLSINMLFPHWTWRCMYPYIFSS